MPVQVYGFDSWFRKIPHALGQLKLCPFTSAAEPTCLEPVHHGRVGHCSEKAACHNKGWQQLKEVGKQQQRPSPKASNK